MTRRVTEDRWQTLSVADESSVPDVIGWITEAGSPYFDWLFGDVALAHDVIEARIRSRSSEVSLEVITALTDAREHLLGGFIGLPGAELHRRRRDDSMAFLQAVPRHDRPALMARMRASRQLFPPVEPEDFYLSKMGVRPDARGRGIGRRLVDRFVAAGVAAGSRGLRLDVYADNVHAIALYTSAGFEVIEESRSEQAGMAYLAMYMTTPDG